jgi:hypothetical protein
MSGVPLYSYYGVPAAREARQAAYDDARIAAASAPYLGRGNLCAANNDTCEGRRAKGTDYCYGHLRSMGLAGKEVNADADVKIDVATDS